MKTPLDTSVEAEYSDGYVLSETEHNDVSPYDSNVNILRSIIEKHPEAEHGPMVRFSLFYKDAMYSVDWKTLPDNARPIRFRQGYNTLYGDGSMESGYSGVNFGYQYTLKGRNHKEVLHL